MHNFSSNIFIERLGRNNLSDLGVLFFAVYGKKMKTGYFQKKYDTAYTGHVYLGYIAYSHNKMPVAFYGVIPCYLCCNGQQVPAAQSADTMTHPAFRGQGLFVKLAEMTVALCRQNGLRLLFGFPNQNSLPGFLNRLGWETNGNMDCFIIPLKANFFARLIRKFLLFENYNRRYQKHVLKKYATSVSEAPYSFFANENHGVWRGEEYILYKQYNPHWFVNFQNSFVWMKTGDGLIIGDMEFNPNDFDALMETLCLVAAKMGLNRIIFHCTKNARLHALFAARCIPIQSFPVICKKLDGELAPDFSFTYADVDTF